MLKKLFVHYFVILSFLSMNPSFVQKKDNLGEDLKKSSPTVDQYYAKILNKIGHCKNLL
jgi:hypothetical protein